MSKYSLTDDEVRERWSTQLAWFEDERDRELAAEMLRKYGANPILGAWCRRYADRAATVEGAVAFWRLEAEVLGRSFSTEEAETWRRTYRGKA